MTARSAIARQPAPRRVARDAFRARLREAAEQVFARAGFHSTKMADVALAAGVAVGTLYNYFDSKEEIFSEVLSERSRDLHALLAEVSSDGTPSERIAAAVRTSFDYLDRHGALFAMFVERGGLAEFDLRRLGGAAYEAEYTRWLRLLLELVRAAQSAGELRRDVPPAAIVATLAGAMNGATYAWLKLRRRGRLVDTADHVLTLFFAGARA